MSASLDTGGLVPGLGKTMKRKSILGLLLISCVLGATANAVPPAPSCDRDCRRGKVTLLLYALLKHDASRLPVADTLPVTEDAVEEPLAEVGLFSTVTRLPGYQQDPLYERGGMDGLGDELPLFG
jgi:hypothetical protein